MNPVYYCQPCRQNRTHREDGSCIQCGALQAVTHPAAFRDDISLNEGKGVQASRKRGQLNLRKGMN